MIIDACVLLPCLAGELLSLLAAAVPPRIVRITRLRQAAVSSRAAAAPSEVPEQSTQRTRQKQPRGEPVQPKQSREPKQPPLKQLKRDAVVAAAAPPTQTAPGQGLLAAALTQAAAENRHQDVLRLVAEAASQVRLSLGSASAQSRPRSLIIGVSPRSFGSSLLSSGARRT